MRLSISWLPYGFLPLLFLAPFPATGFYLPGVVPTSYKEGSTVPLHVNRLTPMSSVTDTQARSAVSFGYYHPGFRFCKPEGGPKDVGPESLGAVIFGDRIKTSPFELYMMKNETCKRLCGEQKFDMRSATFVNRRIRENLGHNWLIDGLPAGQPYQLSDNGPWYYTRGFPLGRHQDEQHQILHNHFDLIIDYHADGAENYRVVGVRVDPSSRAGSKNLDDKTADCGDESTPVSLNEKGETSVTWTYSVYWRPSPIAWAIRWDAYLHIDDPGIHWLSLACATAIVVFLTATVSAILMRALKKDFARYNRLESFNLDDFSTSAVTEDGVQEDSGWKLVHGDVFRPPKNPLLLSIFLGNGAQLFFMTGITIVFALFGFLSPSNRGSLGTAMIVLYCMFAGIGGYVSARVYKAFGGESWKRNIAITPVMVPAIVFGTFFLLNLFLWVQGSSGAVPFTTMLVLVAIWFLISLPLSFGGSWLGFKQAAFQAPVHTNQIPRQIPPSTQYLRPFTSMLIVGFLPFCAIFWELYFIMNSLWFDKLYFMFGFVFLSYGIMIITCASVTIMFVYYLLCSEDYRWQWRSFNSAGASAIFVFGFALIYWILRLRFGGLTSVVLYVGYSSLITFLFFILTGTIGFFSSWAFVQRIYSSIRID
ncbi:hypothetical protein MMC27_004668 [Xylographa pallens]|nr:hypothetical protein [Xylographa pallens]